MHDVADDEEYELAAQGRQDFCPGKDWYCPGGQAWHVQEEVEEKVPGEHGTHWAESQGGAWKPAAHV